MAAAAAGNVEAVKMFIARGANVNVKEQGQEQTALMWAAMAAALASTDVEALRVLLTPRAGQNTLTEPAIAQTMAAVGGGARGRGGFAGGFGATPAGFRYLADRSPAAASALVLDVVKARLDGGTDADASAQNGDTALHVAAQSGNIPLIQLLAARGAKLDAQNTNGFTPLDRAMGRQAPNANAAAAGPGGRGGQGGQGQGGQQGGQGGGAPRGGGRGGPGGGGPQPQLDAVAVLRPLMGLPPLRPEEIPAAAAPARRPWGGGAISHDARDQDLRVRRRHVAAGRSSVGAVSPGDRRSASGAAHAVLRQLP